MEQVTGSSEISTEFKRRLPAMVVYLHPFRLIESKDLEPWQISIEEINKTNWNYVKLHEIVGGIDVGLPNPFHMIIGRDGALALPPIPSLRSDQQAVEFFNHCLAAFLLGGVYCTSVGLDNLEFGSVIDWKYIRSSGGLTATNRFHQLIRMRIAPPIEAILLENAQTINFEDLRIAARDGFALLKLAPGLSGDFLLKGVSGIARRDWGVGLSNLWISIEQLTEVLWQREVTVPIKADQDQISGRRDQLKDTRTWTASNRHEYLHIKGLIQRELLQQLSVARKARTIFLIEVSIPEKFRQLLLTKQLWPCSGALSVRFQFLWLPSI